VQIFFPAIESHLNTVAASILSEPGMKWLMYIANKVGDKPDSSAFLIPCASRDFSSSAYEASASITQLRTL
jgi:hypothetical protein